MCLFQGLNIYFWECNIPTSFRNLFPNIVDVWESNNIVMGIWDVIF